MGWASGVNYQRRTIGYSHAGVCEQEGCTEKIDLGLAYCCGDLDGVDGERGCGSYFCSRHLFFWVGEDDEQELWDGQRCPSCVERLERGETEPFEMEP